MERERGPTRRAAHVSDCTRLIVRADRHRREVVPGWSQSVWGSIFCASVKLPIKYSSRLFNCRNKEQTASCPVPPFARAWLYIQLFTLGEPSMLETRECSRRECLHEANRDRFVVSFARQSMFQMTVACKKYHTCRLVVLSLLHKFCEQFHCFSSSYYDRICHYMTVDTTFTIKFL